MKTANKKYNFIFGARQHIARLAIVLSLFLFCGIFNFASAQSAVALENKFSALNSEFKKESESLNSMKKFLSEKLKEIENAKKSGRSESEIKNLLAGSVTLSDKIDNQQKRLNYLTKEIDGVKKLLDRRYSAEIDSLTALEKSGGYSGNKNDLRAKLVDLAEKRLRVGPSVSALSFSPAKIMEINPAEAKTEDERKVMTEYLSSALLEVDKQIESTKKLRAETEQIISLQEKTRKFLEDVEFDSDPAVSNIMASSNAGIAPSDSRDLLTNQALPFLLLLKQLDTGINPAAKQRERYFNVEGRKNLSIKDYAELLKETEQKLNDYRVILNHRLGNTGK